MNLLIDTQTVCKSDGSYVGHHVMNVCVGSADDCARAMVGLLHDYMTRRHYSERVELLSACTGYAAVRIPHEDGTGHVNVEWQILHVADAKEQIEHMARRVKALA